MPSRDPSDAAEREPDHCGVTARFGGREPWTQSLPFAAGLQDRGWACMLAGGAIVAVQPRPDGARARLQRAQVIDVPQLRRITERIALHSLLVEPALSGVIIDDAGDRHRWDYGGHDGAYDAPFAPLRAAGWRDERHSRTHTKTIVVDLADGAEAAIARFAAVARRNARAAARSPVRYDAVLFDALRPLEHDALRSLYATFVAERSVLRDEWAIRHSVTTHLGPKGCYILAWHDARLLGAVALVTHDRVAAYYAAQSTAEGKRLRVPTGLVVAALRQACAMGCDLFDMFGVHDGRRPQQFVSWRGFSGFKARFGGHDVELPFGLDVPLPATPPP